MKSLKLKYFKEMHRIKTRLDITKKHGERYDPQGKQNYNSELISLPQHLKEMTSSQTNTFSQSRNGRL